MKAAVLLFLMTVSFARAQIVWTPVENSLSDGRWAASACVFPGGKSAILAGGYSFQARRCVATADVFDAASRRFRPSKSRLIFPRDFAPAVPLSDGKIVIFGGYNTVLGTLRTVEIYDAARDVFSLLPAQMTASRELFQATTLLDGRILLSGGFDTHSGKTLASAEIFDPQTGRFSTTAEMKTDRFGHAATLLTDGRVLIVGGKHWFVGSPDKFLASAEIFDPKTGKWTSAEDMKTPRDRPSATRLASGKIVIAGGQNGARGASSIEEFDPATGKWTTIGEITTPRMAHSDALLADGEILLVGGWSPPINATTASTEVFDATTRKSTPGPNVNVSGHDLSLLVFSDGSMLVAGGKRVENGRETSPTSASVGKEKQRTALTPGPSPNFGRGKAAKNSDSPFP